MDKQKKAAWVAALRSGEYSQTAGVLCRPGERDQDGESYCCLGVLTDMAVKEGVGQWSIPNLLDEVRVYVAPSGRTHNGYYSEEVRQWAGMAKLADDSEFFIDYTDPDTGEYERRIHTLAELNDSGFTFDRIADVIDYFL